jgi:hypothetical protein
MRLDDPDHEVHPLAPLGLRGRQHLVRLADPRRGADEHLEAAAPFLIGLPKQCLWRGAPIVF